MRLINFCLLILGIMPSISFGIELGESARDAKGYILHLNQYSAKKYCELHGTRLPTAKELALYAQSLGAQGVSETPKPGYYLVRGTDVAGNPDNFYYSSKGYPTQPPPTEELDSFFWSLSANPDYSTNYAWVLYDRPGGFGIYNSQYHDRRAEVRCVLSPRLVNN